MSNSQYSIPLADPVTDAPDQPGTAVVDLPDGCYRLTVRPALSRGTYYGTLRVDRSDGNLVVSGDLYWFPLGADDDERGGLVGRALADPLRNDPPTVLRHVGIPVYPRNRYHSYLKATAVRLASPQAGMASVTVEQYDYTPPAAGGFNGTFPAAPGSRTAVLRFQQQAAPSARWPGNYYEGQWVRGGIVKGTITLGWVAPLLRACTIEVDTLVDAVSPKEVPALGAAGTESFQTMLASAGWAARVVYDQTEVPKPATVANHQAPWSDADLHALMQSVRKPTTDLDAEWLMHVLVVPGAMGGSRGKMYDSISVPREGVVSYSDDGYPAGGTTAFGTATGMKQRDVPRAYLRSASHEVVHGFNQVHQEQEGGADNSIMTSTPSVADVLGTATSGAPGVFPDDIKLEVNANVRRHMSHFPDPVVRPGGHSFSSWRATPVPAADRFDVGSEYVTLDVRAANDRVELGEPVALAWTLRNSGDADVAVPDDVSTESTYATITVLDSAGRRREMAPFVISCDGTRIAALAPGESLTAQSRVFWSSNGFAFERPGRYTIEVRIDWTVGGAPMTVRAETPVFVNYPTGDSDNAAAAALLHAEVGMWVALGGGAYHLTEAVARLRTTMPDGGASVLDDVPAPAARALRGYAGILPDGR